jgi:hypothetical protein
MKRGRHVGAGSRRSRRDAGLLALASCVTSWHQRHDLRLERSPQCRLVERCTALPRARDFRPRARRPGGLLLGLFQLVLLLPKADSYSCTGDLGCQFEGCKGISCSGYESNSYCKNGVWDAICVSI